MRKFTVCGPTTRTCSLRWGGPEGRPYTFGFFLEYGTSPLLRNTRPSAEVAEHYQVGVVYSASGYDDLLAVEGE